MTFVRGPNTGKETNRVRCLVCDWWINTDVQRIGGGMFRTGTDDGVALVTESTSADPLGVTVVADAAVTNPTKCPGCGTDNWRVGDRGTR